MVESSKKKVIITGVSGFLGSQVCNVYLQDGTFTVRGTVRDKNNEKKLAPLRQAFGDKFQELELVEADLLKPESLDAAIAGNDYVVHTASPFPLDNPKREEELIKPAVEGTMAVVRAAHKHRVKRVVITSSVIAIMQQHNQNIKELFTEDDWSDLTSCLAYAKSKTLAEKAAWDFLHSLPEEERFELVIINPALIMGPSLIAGDFSSGQFVKNMMIGKHPFMPKVKMPIVDVRDVAVAHLQGLKVPEAAGKRFILNAKAMWFKDMALGLKKNYPTGFNIKTGEIGYCPIKMASMFDASVKQILPFWNKNFDMDNTRSREILGI